MLSGSFWLNILRNCFVKTLFLLVVVHLSQISPGASLHSCFYQWHSSTVWEAAQHTSYFRVGVVFLGSDFCLNVPSWIIPEGFQLVSDQSSLVPDLLFTCLNAGRSVFNRGVLLAMLEQMLCILLLVVLCVTVILAACRSSCWIPDCFCTLCQQSVVPELPVSECADEEQCPLHSAALLMLRGLYDVLCALPGGHAAAVHACVVLSLGLMGVASRLHTCCCLLALRLLLPPLRHDPVFYSQVLQRHFNHSSSLLSFRVVVKANSTERMAAY